ANDVSGLRGIEVDRALSQFGGKGIAGGFCYCADRINDSDALQEIVEHKLQEQRAFIARSDEKSIHVMRSQRQPAIKTRPRVMVDPVSGAATLKHEATVPWKLSHAAALGVSRRAPLVPYEVSSASLSSRAKPRPNRFSRGR